MLKHFVKLWDLSKEDALKVLERAKALKYEKINSNILKNKTILLLFEKASTRTRISFEVAVNQLGGNSVFLTTNDTQLGRNEPLKDTARVFSRYADALVIRTYGQYKVDEIIKFSSIPIVNALTDEGHPCQVMSDMLTIYERTPNLSNVKVAWVGDGNNMANSWIEAAMLFPISLTLACPVGYDPDMALFKLAESQGAKVKLVRDPKIAVEDANYVNTDVWASMGTERDFAETSKDFSDYTVDSKLMSFAAKDAKFMHCLPAHRGEEVTEEVLEGESSIVFDQAENRLHMQKAILEWLFLK